MRGETGREQRTGAMLTGGGEGGVNDNAKELSGRVSQTTLSASFPWQNSLLSQTRGYDGIYAAYRYETIVIYRVLLSSY